MSPVALVEVSLTIMTMVVSLIALFTKMTTFGEVEGRGRPKIADNEE